MLHLLLLFLDLILELVLFDLCGPSFCCSTSHLALQVVQFCLSHTGKESVSYLASEFVSIHERHHCQPENCLCGICIPLVGFSQYSHFHAFGTPQSKSHTFRDSKSERVLVCLSELSRMQACLLAVTAIGQPAIMHRNEIQGPGLPAAPGFGNWKPSS